MRVRASRVEACIAEASEIIEAYDDVLKAQQKALTELCGKVYDSESSEENGGNSEIELEYGDEEAIVPPCDATLLRILCMGQYNWFSFVDMLEDLNYGVSNSTLHTFFLNFGEELQTVVQSHHAYVAAELDFYEEDRISRCINGEVITNSDESDCEFGRKKMKLKRKAQRLKIKTLAERRFLSRRVLKKTSKLIEAFPHIGEMIEDYVKDHNVGADSWRRTGVLTFDGNAHLKEKVTYGKIKKYLESALGRNIAYGTVVELCIPRNKRRRSAKRYRSLAQVTTRRAREGFNLRFNPDKHWSAAWYKGLNHLHYEDGLEVFNLNRDDAAGFRLDTLTTCKQYSAPTLHGSAVLTTRTDYVNRYPSILQTTSYNFTKTKKTSEVCVGVVKAPPVHSKNPAPALF